MKRWSERTEETQPVAVDTVDHHTATDLPPGLADASPPWLAHQQEPIFAPPPSVVAPPAVLSAPPAASPPISPSRTAW